MKQFCDSYWHSFSFLYPSPPSHPDKKGFGTWLFYKLRFPVVWTGSLKGKETQDSLILVPDRVNSEIRESNLIAKDSKEERGKINSKPKQRYTNNEASCTEGKDKQISLSTTEKVEFGERGEWG